MLLRHTSFNLIGLGAPLLVATFSIPALIASLGTDRFGLLTLIWAVVSYFGLFDLGLGRALTQQLAITFAHDDNSQAKAWVGTASGIMGVLGILAGLFMAIAAPWGVSLLKAVPDSREAVLSVYGMAAAMPAVVMTSGFRGVLEARNAFGVVNMIRLPMGLFTFLGPLAVTAYLGPRLDLIAYTLAAGRVVACIVHAYFAWRVLPQSPGPWWESKLVKPLFVSGGWLSVSNLISPFMGYVDRFVIGSIVSATAVAYYATPHELVTKLWVVPGALTAVLFPTFSAQMASNGRTAAALFDKAVFMLFLALLPITVALALFANELLAWWLGPSLGAHSGPLLRIFAVGMFVNCLATIPYTLLQSAGRARVTALIHCVELPAFLAALWVLTSYCGVYGAGAAWLLRVFADTALMFAFGNQCLGRSAATFRAARTLMLLVVAAIAFSGMLLPTGLARVGWMVAVTVATLLLYAPGLRRWLAARRQEGGVA